MGLRRTITGLILSALIVLPLSVETVGSAATERKNHPDNRRLVAGAVNNFVAAWNKKNSDSITGLFLNDAVLVMPTGNVTKSRAKIRERLISEWQGKLKDSRLSHAVEDISFQGSEAIVKGRYRLDGVSILGFETAPEGPFVLHQRRQQGRWLIAKAEILRDTDLAR